MSIRIRFRREAEAEAIDALSWYRERSRDLAGEFRKSLDSCLASIQNLPESHPVVYRDIRRALMKRFPYGLFYVKEGELVTVLACFHAKRNPAIWKERVR
jgi:plasmid stabilization system protein ParE